MQLSPEHMTGKVAALLARGDPVHCKRGVVDQTHLFKSIQHDINRGSGHVLGLECLVKLMSSAGSDSQLAQCDGTGHRFDIGVDIPGCTVGGLTGYVRRLIDPMPLQPASVSAGC